MFRNEPKQGADPGNISEEMLAVILGRKDAAWRCSTTIRMTDVTPLTDFWFACGWGDTVELLVDYTEPEVAKLFHHNVHGLASEMKPSQLSANLEQTAQTLWPSGSLEHFAMRVLGVWVLLRFASGVKTMPSVVPCCVPFTYYRLTTVKRLTGIQLTAKEKAALAVASATTGTSPPKGSSKSTSVTLQKSAPTPLPRAHGPEPKTSVTSLLLDSAGPVEFLQASIATYVAPSTEARTRRSLSGAAESTRLPTPSWARRLRLPSDFQVSEVDEWVEAVMALKQLRGVDPYLQILTDVLTNLTNMQTSVEKTQKQLDTLSRKRPSNKMQVLTETLGMRLDPFLGVLGVQLAAPVTDKSQSTCSLPSATVDGSTSPATLALAEMIPEHYSTTRTRRELHALQAMLSAGMPLPWHADSFRLAQNAKKLRPLPRGSTLEKTRSSSSSRAPVAWRDTPEPRTRVSMSQGPSQRCQAATVGHSSKGHQTQETTMQSSCGPFDLPCRQDAHQGAFASSAAESLQPLATSHIASLAESAGVALLLHYSTDTCEVSSLQVPPDASTVKSGFLSLGGSLDSAQLLSPPSPLGLPPLPLAALKSLPPLPPPRGRPLAAATLGKKPRERGTSWPSASSRSEHSPPMTSRSGCHSPRGPLGLLGQAIQASERGQTLTSGAACSPPLAQKCRVAMGRKGQSEPCWLDLTPTSHYGQYASRGKMGWRRMLTGAAESETSEKGPQGTPPGPGLEEDAYPAALNLDAPPSPAPSEWTWSKHRAWKSEAGKMAMGTQGRQGTGPCSGLLDPDLELPSTWPTECPTHGTLAPEHKLLASRPRGSTTSLASRILRWSLQADKGGAMRGMNPDLPPGEPLDPSEPHLPNAYCHKKAWLSPQEEWEKETTSDLGKMTAEKAALQAVRSLWTSMDEATWVNSKGSRTLSLWEERVKELDKATRIQEWNEHAESLLLPVPTEEDPEGSLSFEGVMSAAWLTASYGQKCLTELCGGRSGPQMMDPVEELTDSDSGAPTSSTLREVRDMWSISSGTSEGTVAWDRIRRDFATEPRKTKAKDWSDCCLPFQLMSGMVKRPAATPLRWLREEMRRDPCSRNWTVPRRDQEPRPPESAPCLAQDPHTSQTELVSRRTSERLRLLRLPQGTRGLPNCSGLQRTRRLTSRVKESQAALSGMHQKLTRCRTAEAMSSSGSDSETWSFRRTVAAGRQLTLLAKERKLTVDAALSRSGHSLLAELGTRHPAGGTKVGTSVQASTAIQAMNQFAMSTVMAALPFLSPIQAMRRLRSADLFPHEAVATVASWTRKKYTSSCLGRGYRRTTAQEEKLVKLGQCSYGSVTHPTYSPDTVDTSGEGPAGGDLTAVTVAVADRLKSVNESVKAEQILAAELKAKGKKGVKEAMLSRHKREMAEAGHSVSVSSSEGEEDPGAAIVASLDAESAAAIAAEEANIDSSTLGSLRATSKIKMQVGLGDVGGETPIARTLLAHMHHNRRTVNVDIDGITFVAVLGTEFNKERSMGKTAIVGFQVGPMPVLPNVYTNSATNVGDAIYERFEMKEKPCTWTPADLAKIGAFVKNSMSANSQLGWCSKARIEAWIERKFDLQLNKSKKWSDVKMANAIDQCIKTTFPWYSHSTKVKLEQMKEGKPPRFLIIDGDEGNVMALLVICCFEDLLFEWFGDKSIKHKNRFDAIEAAIKSMVPPKDKKDDWGCVEGDGTAWDTTCNITVRNAIENPLLWHIGEVFAGRGVVPEQWHEAHMLSCTNNNLKLRFKSGLDKMMKKISSIRRSGHRGTSCLNWWVNYTMWCCSVFEEPSSFLNPLTRNGKDVNGRIRWFNGCFEGDDSLVSTSPKFKEGTTVDGKYVLHKDVDIVVAFWDRAGFDMKFIFCASRATFCGTHIVCTDGRIGTLFCPELPRALASSVCTTAPAIELLKMAKKGTAKGLINIMAAKAMSRAADFAGILPSVSQKYYDYAMTLRGPDDDFVDRELSYHATGDVAKQGAAISYSNVAKHIVSKNANVTPTEELGRFEALGYGFANDMELIRFTTYNWDHELLLDYDGYRDSLPVSWRPP